MAERRFPRPDADFAAYINNYYGAVEKWWSVNELDETDLKPFKDALSGWSAAFPAHVAAQQRAEAARQNNDEARRGVEAQARPLTAFIQGDPKTTDADRATIGITIRAVGGGATPAPSSKPFIVVESAARYTHERRLVDESAPTRGDSPRASSAPRSLLP
jgi:hypothetical protein